MHSKNFFTFLVLMLLVFVFSCGKKGEPTLKAFQKPSTVSNIKAIHRENEINIFWQYPEAEKKSIKGCIVLRADGEALNFKEAAFLKHSEQTFSDKDITLKNDYYYKIKCISLKDVYSDDSPVIKVQTLPPPQQPNRLTYMITNDSIKVHWQQVEGAKYNIYKSYQKGIYSIKPYNPLPIQENYYIDKIDTSKIVYYSVSSHLGTDVRNESRLSDELEINPADFIPSTPTGLIYVPIDKKILLLWKESPETWVKGYRIYRKKTPDKDFTLIGEVISPVFTDQEHLDSKTIYYITALGPIKESQPSKELVIESLQEN